MVPIHYLGAFVLVASLPATVAVRLTDGVPRLDIAARAQTADIQPMSLQQPGDAPIVLPRAADGMFYLRARINGVPVRFLVDTGASSIVLTGADAASVGLGDAGLPGALLKTPAGTIATRWTKLDLQLNGRTLDGLDVAMIEEGVGVSLLGQNALAAFGSITIERDQMILR